MTDEHNTDNPRPAKRKKHHLIRPAWLRIPLKILVGVLVFILLLPVLVYLPPVQAVLKDVACRVASDATGMKIEIGRFRLMWPLDVALDDVLVVEATGDTMVRAQTLVADVKLMPLLDLDIRLNALRLKQGYYRMVSPDSSMVMKINAGLLDADNRSSFNLKEMRLVLNRARLRDGNVSLFMDVWKKVPNPDTTSNPFFIQANHLQLENIDFAMSMRPTIDTLTFHADRLNLTDGIIDLGRNEIRAGLLSGDDGALRFITPTAQYIKTHPAPIDTISPPSPPMTIMADSIALNNFKVLYAVDKARPLPGFDASYMDLTDVNISLRNFYNQASTLRLPITRLLAKERCGLQIEQGEGLVTVDSVGLGLQDLFVRTSASTLYASAQVPFALMEMKPHAPFSAHAKGNIAFSDVTAFMPSVGQYTRMLSPGRSLLLDVDASGTLSSVHVARLDAEVPRIFTLRARGDVDSPMDMNRLRGRLAFNASLVAPEVAQRMMGQSDVHIPSFAIKGTAEADRQNYAVNFEMRSSAGDVAADGRVSLNAETYQADVTAHNLNVAHIMPSLQVGVVNAHVTARGAGFNPTRPGAATDIHLDVAGAQYAGHNYRDIRGDVSLHNGVFDINLTSNDPMANLDVKGSGSIKGSQYALDMHARIEQLDLQALGLSKTVNHGHGDIFITGTAVPDRWLYNVDLDVSDFAWYLPDVVYSLPAGITAHLVATADNVDASLLTDGIDFAFTGDTGLKRLIDKFTSVAESATRQIEHKHLDVDELERLLPGFTFNLNASGHGLLGEVLQQQGYAVDTLSVHLENVDSIISGRADVLSLNTGTMVIDTLGLDLSSRGSMLDYALHIGNQPGNLPEFAKVDINGYVGGNRLSAYLKQINDQGQTGYKLGFTAALQDSTVTLRFTPLKATIAYMPWTLNTDNYVEYTFGQKNPLDANLFATSAQSSLLLKTEVADDGGKQQHLNLHNIRVQDFTGMNMLDMPDLKAAVDADLTLKYRGSAMTGSGTASVRDLEYNGTQMGNYDASFDASLDFNGNTQARAALKVNGADALVVSSILHNGDDNAKNEFAVDLTSFPLSVANAFLDGMLELGGSLNGHMSLDGDFSDPKLNGQIAFADAYAQIPMLGARLNFGTEPVTVSGNVVRFNQFKILGKNANPIVVDGVVDASDFNKISADLALDGDNFQLVGAKESSGADLYGKLFMNLHAKASGPMSLFDVTGTATVLSNTDVTYNIPDAEAALNQANTDVVRFVNLNDTAALAASAKPDTLSSPLAMRIQAGLTIQPGAKVTVNLSSNKSDRVVVNPSGTLNYFQNYMGDMRLNGTLQLGDGYARYSLPVVGEKMFTLRQGSYVRFSGDILNPAFNIDAYDDMKVNVNVSGSSRVVPFIISLGVTGDLKTPKIAFDLDADGDMAIQNELSSMTPDQRSQQAMNLLITGQYSGPNTKTQNGNLGEQALYGFLTSQINNWTANHIKGVDLNFGINQYDNTSDGRTSSSMTYSYQLSKSLLNNKFKIVVGGNYNTDASADDNFAENLLSDVSFEYMLKQSNNLSMLVKLFRQYNYESVLEGQVSETGVGFVMKRRMSNLRRFFNVRWGKRKTPSDAGSQPADSTNTRKP